MKRKVKDKKKVVGFIGLATAAFCSFGIASATNPSTNDLYGAKAVKVYAEEADTHTTTWNNAIATLKAIDGANINNKSDYVDYLFAYIDATDAYSKVSATVLPEDEVAYQLAGEIIRKDADCYRYFANSLSKLFKNQNIAWSHKVDYDANVNYLATLDTYKQEVFADIVKFTEMCTYADDEFARIKTALDEVVLAIEGIYYVDGNIVVNSKTSLDAVDTAIKNVYNKPYAEISEDEVTAMATYVEKLGDYDSAIEDYEKIVAECVAMDATIVEAYNNFTTEEGTYYNKYYTQRTVITNLRVAHDALNRGPEDNATTLLKETAKLVELETALANVDADKLAVEGLISAIPVDFDYTDLYIATVEDAKEAFDLLPEDLKAIADTEIAGYAVLVDALEDIKTCKDAVDALIERAKALETLYNEGSEKFSSEVNAVAKERTKFEYQKQKADFDAECGDLLFEMQTRLDNLSATITPFIDAVEAIGEVKLSNTAIGSQIATAKLEYDKLTTDLERNAVLAYKKILDTKEDALNELMAEANAWKADVEAIVLNTPVTMENVATINAVETALETIKAENLDMYTVITTSADLYGYTAFETLIVARDNLLVAVEQLALDMAALSTDLSVIVADPSTFNIAVETANATFEALDTSVQAEYFTADASINKASYDNYLVAFNLYNKVAKLAGDIAALYDITTVDMTKYDAIMEYNKSYEALEESDKAILEAQKINSDKTFKEVLDGATEKVTGLKEAIDAWIDAVGALDGGIEKANWETELYAVNLDTIATLKAERLALDNSRGDLNDADADIVAIENIANKRVSDLNDLIAELDAKSQLENTDVAILESIYDIYNNKLDKTQKDLVDYVTFEVLYNRYVFAQNFDEVVLSLKKDVIDNKNYTSDVPITIGILRSVYINFGTEMKALIQEYATLDTIEAEYNAHVEGAGEVLNLTGVYNSLLAKIEADGSDLATEIEGLSTQIAKIQNDYSELVQDLADAKVALEKADADNKQELINLINTLENKVNTLKSDLEKADTDNLAQIRGELAGVKEDLEKLVADTKAELLAEIDALEKSLADAKVALEKADADNKQELINLINTLENKVNTLKSDLEKADADNLAQIRGELADVKEDLEKLVTDTKAELLAEIDSLRKNLTTITIILSIVSGLAFVGVIVLVIKKKN